MQIEKRKEKKSSLLSQGRLGHLGKVYLCSQKHFLPMLYVENDAAQIWLH